MVISKTPVRLDFLGGLSDIKNFYSLHTGAVVNGAINKYIYVVIKNSAEDKYKIRYGIKSEVASSISQIKDARTRAALTHFGLKSPIEIISLSDVLPGTGLGSSGAFMVGLINALAEFKGQKISPRDIAELAVHIETNILKEPIGKQDQYAAALGGTNLLKFYKSEKVDVTPIKFDFKKLQKHMLLVNTGSARSAAKLLEIQKAMFEQNIEHIKKIAFLSLQGKKYLEQNDIKSFAQTLEEEWNTKKLTGPITNKKIERMYKIAKDNRAWGAKISGAGQGGYMIIIAPVHKHSAIKKAFVKYEAIEVNFVSQGSQIIYSDKRQ